MKTSSKIKFNNNIFLSKKFTRQERLNISHLPNIGILCIINTTHYEHKRQDILLILTYVL